MPATTTAYAKESPEELDDDPSRLENKIVEPFHSYGLGSSQ